MHNSHNDNNLVINGQEIMGLKTRKDCEIMDYEIRYVHLTIF